ncbi:hypothetical protein TVAG_488100 [Trichomonas vaginalis G3]|uniref:Uncharacterized protein n=1 Tax=Trichomonas vaginalis (strain ATCC PRA-98 / G3) TaxID=412133 RepID=A2E6K3_TRIV3|nr:hypothetical protein TVAGG3_0974820 [Trichomonas vaginalis G3]EAY11708.1 hypothetical protein TVAG_488100 [Trichomonas vaginalis G3]KAI5488852.1 hypothetical protein TVAGG3_0974820 [Trichomonas vaginalis G3]|eukprot:XP_001323931.1 hypothetical protein [Trichomonas vaginalis G3]
MDYEKLSETSTLKVRLSKETKPFYISVDKSSQSHYINSVLASIFDRPPSTYFNLSRDDDKSLSINLTQFDTIDVPKKNSCTLAYITSDYDFDAKFKALYDAGVPIPKSVYNEEIADYLFGQKLLDVSSYQPTLFLQRVLALSIIDIINDKPPNAFTISVVNSIDFSPTSVFKPVVITNALINVIIDVFGEICLWDESNDPKTMPQFNKFVGLLAATVARSKRTNSCIRDALDQFCPSYFAESFITLFVAKIQTRLTETDTFRVLSEIFGDFWIIRAFRTRNLLNNFIYSLNTISVLPYVGIYCITAGFALDGQNSAPASISILQIGSTSLFTSSRVAPMVIDPILEAIYSQPLSSDLPFLEMTEQQLISVNIKLNAALPIFQATITKSRTVQNAVLDYIVEIISRHSFEPKGLLLTIFSFLFEKDIIQPSVFNNWMQISFNSDGKHAALLEINSMLMTLIPGSFPPTNKVDLLPKRAAQPKEGPPDMDIPF